MKYIVKLKKRDNTEVTAVVEAKTEEEAKNKALNTANNIAKNNLSVILKTDRPLKVISIEAWETKSKKILPGMKRYGVMVTNYREIEENRMVGFAGEKSVYNSVLKTLMPEVELVVYIIDLDQEPEKVEPKKPEVDANGNIKLTIAEAISDNRVSFNEFYSVLQDAGLTDEDVLNSTEIIEQYIKEKVAEDIDVFHIMEALREGSDTDLWRIWLGNSMETPEPIETKKDLMEVVEDSMSFDEEKDYKRRFVFNIRNR